MKKILNLILKIVGGLIVVITLVVAVLYFNGKARANKQYTSIEARPLAIAGTPEDLVTGEKWAETLCTNCHAPDLSGQILIQDESLGMINSPNLTGGEGGIGASYTNQDWVRALRHGLGTDSKPLIGMPSDAFYYMNDKDLAALIAYLQSVPAVDNAIPPTDLKPLAYILVSLGMLGDVFPTEHIPHKEIPLSPAPGLSVEFGQYLVRIGDCDNCHGPNLSGGESPVPGSPPGPNITPGGTLAFWSAEDFIATIRTGQTPYGRVLNPEYMPWDEYSNLSDEELSAILLYLQSLPALDYGQ
ncbi:MAG: c-type cytochrome [Anaerolineales bacterium]|nr:c-type cytochrome [Anaerolineales bacterium]